MGVTNAAAAAAAAAVQNAVRTPPALWQYPGKLPMDCFIFGCIHQISDPLLLPTLGGPLKSNRDRSHAPSLDPLVSSSAIFSRRVAFGMAERDACRGK